MSVEIVAQYGEKHPIQLGLYPDNTPVVDIDQFDRIHKPLAMVLRANSMAEFFTGMMICESMAERGRRIPNLIIPAIPGARQDRLKWEGDMLFTLKYVAKAINAQGFDRVVTLDTHSIATGALIDRLVAADVRYANVVDLAESEYDGIIAPDAGAAKRADLAAAALGLPMYQASKHRDPATNKLSGFAVPDDLPSHSHFLVVDDLCDAGGTFLGLANAIKDAGSTADLFVTHGLFTKGTEQLAKAYHRLYTTDSIDFHHERVTRFPIIEGLLSYV